MKKYIALLVFQTAAVLTWAQDERDSTDFGLDSLLDRSVRQTEFVSSASKYAQAVYEAPNSLNVISNSTFKTYGYSQLSEALNYSDGIFINNDLNYEYVGIMGFGKPTDYNNRVQLLFDGHRLNDYVYNAIPLDELAIDINILDQVEVIKGPGSVLYGAGAMFGIINLIPRKSDNNLIPKIRLRYGSYNSRAVSGIIGYENENKFGFTLHVHYAKSDGMNFYFPEYDNAESNNGFVENLDGETKTGIYASLRYGNFELFGVSSYRLKEVPTMPYEVDFGSTVETKDIYNFLEAKYSSQLDYNKKLSIRLFYDQYKYSGVYYYNQLPTWDNNNSKSVGAEIQFLWDLIPNDRIVIGGEIIRAYKVDYNYWDDYQTFSTFNVPLSMHSFYFQNEYQLNDNLIIYLAARFDSFENSDSKISPRATVVYSPDDKNTLRFLAGTSYRNPAAYEKYIEDPFSGIKKNEALTSERVLTYELSWNRRFSKYLSGDISFYRNSISSFIESIIDPNDNLQYYANNLNIKSYGFGAGLKADFETAFGGYISVQHQNSHDDLDNKLSVTPDNMIKTGIYYKFFDRLLAGFEYRYESSKTNVYGNSLPAIHFSSISFSNTKKIFGLNFSFVIKNLFNKSIINPGGLQNIQAGVTMPGRNYLFSVGFGL